MRSLIACVVLLTACADAVTSPIHQPALSAIPEPQTTAISTSATFVSNHVTVSAPSLYGVDFGQAVGGRIVEVEYSLQFGADKLDGGECVSFFDEVSGAEYCNAPGAEPLASKILTFSCDTTFNTCHSFEDGRSEGVFFVNDPVTFSDVAVDVAEMRVTVRYVTEHGVGPVVLVDQFGGAAGTSLNGRRLPTGGGTWGVPYGSAMLEDGVARLRMTVDPAMADREECQGPVPNEDLCYVYGAMTLMLDRAIGSGHEILISIRDYQPDQALGIWTMADPWPWYIGTFLWMDAFGVWAITPEGDMRVPTGEIQRGDYTLRIFDVDFATHRFSLEVVGKLQGGGILRGVKSGLEFGEANMRALAITIQADPGKERGARISGVRILTR